MVELFQNKRFRARPHGGSRFDRLSITCLRACGDLCCYVCSFAETRQRDSQRLGAKFLKSPNCLRFFEFSAEREQSFPSFFSFRKPISVSENTEVCSNNIVAPLSRS